MLCQVLKHFTLLLILLFVVNVSADNTSKDKNGRKKNGYQDVPLTPENTQKFKSFAHKYARDDLGKIMTATGVKDIKQKSDGEKEKYKFKANYMSPTHLHEWKFKVTENKYKPGTTVQTKETKRSTYEIKNWG